MLLLKIKLRIDRFPAGSLARVCLALAWLIASLAMPGHRCFAQAAAPSAPPAIPGSVANQGPASVPATAPTPTPAAAQGSASANGAATPVRQLPVRILPPPSRHDAKLAEQHYRKGRQYFKKGNLERAEGEYAEASRLYPANATYVEERELTRAKLVDQLVNQASQARRDGNHAAADQALSEAHSIDPANTAVDEQVRAEATAIEPAVLPSGDLTHVEFGAIELKPTPGKQPIHYRGSGQELVRQTFQKYGITATLDSSVPNPVVRVDTEDLDFQHAIQIVSLQTGSFYVPLDPHRVLVAKDTPENREKFERQYVETIYLPGVTTTELQDASNVAKQILAVKEVSTDPANGTMTIRAPDDTLDTVNKVLTDLYEGNSQVLIKLTLYQITQTHQRVVGVQLPSQVTLFNIPAELASLYAQYGSIIQQLIASGLVSANNPLEILAALIASGELSNSPFTQGFVTFGGGLTDFAGEIGSGGTANAALNSTRTHQLDQVQMRVGNLETATFREGTRYPIISSSYSSVGISTAALGTAGTNIMQLLNQSGLGSALATATTPNVQYQDLGLTIKATPTIQQTGDISLKLEMQLSALAGSSLNNVPVLNNREFKTVIGVKEGEASVITSNLSRQETKSLTGIPGLNDIPGFPATNVSHEMDTSQLVMVIEPRVVRFDHPFGHGQLILLPHRAISR